MGLRVLTFLIAVSAQAVELKVRDFAPPPPERLARELLKSVCAGGIQRDADGRLFLACSACPDYTGLQAANWELTSIHRGHFTSPKADEIAVGVHGCESHSQNGGGTLLFRRSGSRWKMQWYEASLIIHNCLKAVRNPTGRDLLVCTFEDGHQGFITRTLYAVDLSAPAEHRATDLLIVSDTRYTYEMIGPLQKAILRQVQIDPNSGYISAAVEFGRRNFTKSEIANRRSTAPEPATKRYRVNFRFDGTGWQVTPDSAGAKTIVETTDWPG